MRVRIRDSKQLRKNIGKQNDPINICLHVSINTLAEILMQTDSVKKINRQICYIKILMLEHRQESQTSEKFK